MQIKALQANLKLSMLFLAFKPFSSHIHYQWNSQTTITHFHLTSCNPKQRLYKQTVAIFLYCSLRLPKLPSPFELRRLGRLGNLGSSREICPEARSSLPISHLRLSLSLLQPPSILGQFASQLDVVLLRNLQQPF